MYLDRLPEDVRRIFLDALVTYSDACTLPGLTPSCPFYREDRRGPTCDEECRKVAEHEGVADRAVGTATIGGLVMTGRKLPRAVAAGASTFDANQLYVAERDLECRDQSTTSLLLGLMAELRPPLIPGQEVHQDRALSIWQELLRRRVPIENIARDGILPQIAFGIGVRVALPHMLRTGVLPPHVSVELAREMSGSTSGAWHKNLDALVDNFPDHRSALAAGQQGMSDVRGMGSMVNSSLVAESLDPSSVEAMAADPHITLALSGEFLGRAEEWISRLFEHDLLAALRADAPPPSIFLALPSGRGVRDETGLWLWDRMTLTSLEDWSDSSLLLEWRMHRESYSGSCDPRVLAERMTSHEEIANLALDRLARPKGRRQRPKDLNPGHFVSQATAHLREGDWEKAAAIFRSLVEIRPADGDSWNNLGFCQIPGDAGSALSSLERATLYERDNPLINVANRCLAFHLLRQDDAAVALAESSMHLVNAGSPTAFLWSHCSREQPLVLVEATDPGEYLIQLYEHIRNGC